MILLEQIKSCKHHSCIFQNNSFPPIVPSEINIPAVVMFIGENPSWAENQDIPFASNTISGNALEQFYLKPLGLSRQEVWITDLIKCKYPRTDPKNIYHSKTKFNNEIQSTATICSNLWLNQEIEIVNPKVIVTLSNKEVFQRFRKIYNIICSSNFNDIVATEIKFKLNNKERILFPMIHPDISREIGYGDNRKIKSREKWSVIHRDKHIPRLKSILERYHKAYC